MTRRTSSSRTASAAPTVLRIREPGDILGLIPYLLGFHPAESLVAAFVRQRRVVVTARVDLAATADLEALIDQFELVADQVDTRAIVLVGYSADESVRDVMRGLADVIPFDLVDVLAVSGDRWWSVCCDGDCCPAEGQAYDIEAHPLAVEAVMAGISATGTRDDIMALTAGPPAAERDRLTAAAEECAGKVDQLSRRRRRRRVRQLVDRVLSADGPTDAEAVEIAVLVRDIGVRDEVWAMMTRQDAEAYVALWRRVVAISVWPYEPAPLAMLGWAGWLDGNGALLNCCIDRLEQVAPDYGLLELCKQISNNAIPPRYLDQIADQLRIASGW
ncbi:hypothetical protein MLP_34830 [Microlunatus phosphovorus NM-1]|uniref:DUF4192 domain-containing protein n=1 Tax=Microlunatus phosphovorus (strain ATCC 700054 / DSM 10555 / JCM 9379 / NBRC 101784 / NCIMB 13414 / VKM Ac-1990 / NM-1) TaxID=1032480 RepID=F5XN47_MICPN|nr:DUF4192 domain-containing protein [Microlunatus phosphovorus]BAK36497.1 hypothetical protein MLP_34830 [Microlunatus phosphovorus NM-1]